MPADFQSPLDSLKEYLDWNRWMIIGLVLWGLLVAIVLGAGTGVTAVPCKGPDVTSTVVECTCEYPFPGTMWVVGLVIMFVTVIVELVTDVNEVSKNANKMVKCHFGNDSSFQLKSPENVATLRNLARHKSWVTAQLTFMMQNKSANEISEKVLSIPDFISLSSPSSLPLSNPPLIDALWSNPPVLSENFSAPVSLSSYLTPEESLLVQLVADMEVRDALQNTIMDPVPRDGAEKREKREGHIEIIMDNNPNNNNNKNYNPGQLRITTTENDDAMALVARQRASAETRIKPFVVSQLEAWVRQKKAQYGLIKLKSPYGVSSIIGRGISNLFLFYTIIAITTYNWFPIDETGADKGCWIPWQSRHMKDNSLLGIGMAAIVLLAIRIILFDIIDTATPSKNA